MRRLILYLETSVPNMLLATEASEKRAATEALWGEIESGRYEAVISDVVLDEIEASPAPVRVQLAAALERIQAGLVRYSPEADALAETLIAEGVVPASYLADAQHIAVAIVESVDALVSWNLEHIVKWRVKRQANAIALAHGYRTLEILTPQEVVEHAR